MERHAGWSVAAWFRSLEELHRLVNLPFAPAWQADVPTSRGSPLEGRLDSIRESHEGRAEAAFLS